MLERMIDFLFRLVDAAMSALVGVAMAFLTNKRVGSW